jgi:hypothetical protein
MNTQPRSLPSARWCAPEYVASGGFWRSRLRMPDSAGPLDTAAYGPDREACIRETRRMDRERARRIRARRGGAVR